MYITDLAIKRSTAVFVLVAGIIIAGTSSYISLPREASPDITIPFIIVNTPYFGVSPADVESLVTQPIEKELKSIENVKEIRSASSEGLSGITIEFEPDVDIQGALQKVRDKVNQAKSELPQDIEEPVISEINFSNLPVMIINISGNYSLELLKDVGEEVKDEIEKIPGILGVTLTGGLEREVKVNIDPAKLRYFDISVDDVIKTIRDENLTVPGGSMDLGNYKYQIRVPGEFEAPEVIESLVLKMKGPKPVYIRDVARVEYGFKEVESYARLNNVQCISLSITKRSGENLIRISDEIKELIKNAKTAYPSGTDFSITSDKSEDIRKLVDDLENNIISGLILVVLVLFLFLGFRTAIFVALAIPFSMLISFVTLEAFGVTLNMVVLFSLILALGMLVDNAIVIVENIYRLAEEGMDMKEAARKGTSEVGIPVMIATVTTICAFFPILFWPGIMGEFMSYLPITLIITLLASLFVALVISPVLCASMLKVKPRGGAVSDRTDVRMLVKLYRALLKKALGHPFITLFSSAMTLILALVLYYFLGQGVQFFPDTDPAKIFIEIETPIGSNLEATNNITKKVEEQLKEAKDIKQYVANVGITTGIFNNIGGSGPSNMARIAVDFIDMKNRAQSSFVTTEEIRKRTADMVGAKIRVEMESNGPPSGPPVNIEISGDEYKILGDIASKVEGKIKKITGLVDLDNDYKIGRPEIMVRIDREKAAHYGLGTRKIANTISTAIKGTKSSSYREYEDEYDIMVRFQEDSRSSIQNMREIYIAHEGKQIPLSNIANIELSSGAGTLLRKDLKKVVTVSAKVESRLPANALQEVQEVLKDLKLPDGYNIEYTGEKEEQQKSEVFLKKAFMIAVLLIAFVLVLEFNSILTSSIIMLSVLLSLIGVFIGLLITGTPFGVIMTGIGVISLAGIVVNNAIVLLDYMLQLRDKGVEKIDALVTAGITRFRPVLLTAVTTILGLIPMATGYYFDFKKMEWISGSESSQWWGPMAVAVIFGLSFATVLTLIVVPVLYSVLDGAKVKARGWFAR